MRAEMQAFSRTCLRWYPNLGHGSTAVSAVSALDDTVEGMSYWKLPKQDGRDDPI